jgi:translation initiation factor IF-3
LIGADGQQLGIVPINEALDKARESELDLVEVSPNSRPPVCRIMDYGKFKYELAKKEKVARKRQHSYQLKEMRFRPKIDGHDYDFKCKHVREFLESGSKVRAYVMFRGRELAYTERGRILLERVIEDMVDIAIVDVAIKREGRNMSMILGPNAETQKRLKESTRANVTDDQEAVDFDEDSQDEVVANSEITPVEIEASETGSE